MSIESEIAAVKVHIVGTDVKPPDTPVKPCIRTVPSQAIFLGTSVTNQSHHLLPLAPNRKCATISVIGQSTDIVYIALNKGDAENLTGAPLMGLQSVRIYGSNEIHVGAAGTTNVIVSVLADYES